MQVSVHRLISDEDMAALLSAAETAFNKANNSRLMKNIQVCRCGVHWGLGGGAALGFSSGAIAC